jgi:hypothetical protein
MGVGSFVCTGGALVGRGAALVASGESLVACAGVGASVGELKLVFVFTGGVLVSPGGGLFTDCGLQPTSAVKAAPASDMSNMFFIFIISLSVGVQI